MAVLCCLVLAAVSVWGVVSPRGQWWALTASRYRDPDANEPSDAAYAWTRVSSVLGVVLFGGGAVLLLTLGR